MCGQPFHKVFLNIKLFILIVLMVDKVWFIFEWPRNFGIWIFKIKYRTQWINECQNRIKGLKSRRGLGPHDFCVGDNPLVDQRNSLWLRIRGSYHFNKYGHLRALAQPVFLNRLRLFLWTTEYVLWCMCYYVSKNQRPYLLL